MTSIWRKTRISSCVSDLGGLFISIHHGKIYFLHQTAREFLLAIPSPATTLSELRWQHSISIRYAHTVLAEVCVPYLNFFNTEVNLLRDKNEEAGCYIDDRAFLDYSAENWGLHFREARISNETSIISAALRICDLDSKSYSIWFEIYWKTTNMKAPKYFPGLMVGSYFGHGAVVQQLLATGAADVEIEG